LAGESEVLGGNLPQCLWFLRFVVFSVNQVLDQYSTKAKEEEEVAENKATFLDALKGLEAARKCMCQFDTDKSIPVICMNIKN
jgi:hypothetical protein